MATTSRNKSSVSYSYLMAGDRSSPVLRDSSLETGSPKTIYLFNLKRGAIIEYAMDVVAGKLRDLKPDESAWIAELDAGYKKARRSFRGRSGRERLAGDATIIPLRQVEDDSDSNDFGGDDSDLWLESEEA